MAYGTCYIALMKQMNEYCVGKIKIEQYIWDVVDSNSFLIRENDHSLLIDAIDSNELYNAIANSNDLLIILTHSHFDHINGLNKIRKLNPHVSVLATSQCSINIGNKYRNMSSVANAFMSFYRGKPYEGSINAICCDPADKVFENDEKINWNGHRIELLTFYGHSNDSLMVVLAKQVFFSGDTLLSTPTVTRFPGGNTDRFWNEDIHKIEQIDAELVFPGHGLPGTKAEMIRKNYETKKKD